MKTSFTSKQMIERLAAAKLDGVTVQEMFERLQNEGVTISIHWFRKVWTALPKRKSVATMTLETSIASRLQALNRLGLPLETAVQPAALPPLNTTTTAPPQKPPMVAKAPIQPQTIAKAMATTPAAPAWTQAAAQPTCSQLEMTAEEALVAIERVIQAEYTPDWSFQKSREEGETVALEALDNCAFLRASMTAIKKDQKDEFAASGLKTLNDFYPPLAPGARGVGTILRAWLRDEALRFPKFI